MKRAWFVLVVLVFMLAAGGAAVADTATPDDGGCLANKGWRARLAAKRIEYKVPGQPEVDVDGGIRKRVRVTAIRWMRVVWGQPEVDVDGCGDPNRGR